MDWRMYGNASAKTALEMAFFDLAGKAAQHPVAELPGCIRRTRMPILYMLATGHHEPDVAAPNAQKDAGVVALKIKVGPRGAVEADIERDREIPKAGNGGAPIPAADHQAGHQLGKGT